MEGEGLTNIAEGGKKTHNTPIRIFLLWAKSEKSKCLNDVVLHQAALATEKHREITESEWKRREEKAFKSKQ